MGLEAKLKHLEFIQAIITRMNTNSFLLKGWAVTLVSALFALAAKDTNGKYVIVTYIPILIFWILDGYYLSQERKFRALYNTVKDLQEEKIKFDLDVSTDNEKENTWNTCISSKSLLFFYGALVVVTLLVMFLIQPGRHC
ncbi:hypothetical protein CLV59_105496 [Chitinophaga dinghuensis]|uniref:Uncharacterized protein n=1 Tax=Chitinophaga dinghuensis TaxID=1539050 RepID=A0A327VWL4_9BACT|nr:hypothetical protein [Chitinophaga dinghuensis]RAJ80387.1 hypothetical protein CLV59_105496 [Chitinophaga dinghuensis]